VKCKFVVIIMWNNFVRIKFHFYHLATILWGVFFFFLNFVILNFNIFFIIMRNVFTTYVVIL